MKSLMFLTAAAIALVPATGFAATMSTSTYLAKAGAGDMFEMESSKLVLDSKDPKLASFAQMMIDDHTKSTNDVVTAAKADGIDPAPPKLMPKQEANLAALKNASGTKRDALYKKQQVMAHKEALMVQKEYAMHGDKPNLKSTAATIVPVVEHHLSEVTAMAKM